MWKSVKMCQNDFTLSLLPFSFSLILRCFRKTNSRKCWQCPISFYRHLVFEVFQTRVAYLCFCLVRIRMPLLILAAAEIYYQNSCKSQACISFLRCFRASGAPIRKILVHTLNAAMSWPFVASNYANSYLVPISFWTRSGCCCLHKNAVAHM